MNNFTEGGLDLIKKYEGFRAKSYKCPAGIWTIGYGHSKNLDPSVGPDQTITKDQAVELLKKDIYKTFGAVVSRQLGTTKITDNQYSALCSIAYNCGRIPKDLLAMIKNNPNDPRIREVWENTYVTAKGKKLQGLVKRRKSEADLYFQSSKNSKAVTYSSEPIIPQTTKESEVEVPQQYSTQTTPSKQESKISITQTKTSMKTGKRVVTNNYKRQ